jgi:DNA-binding CsgD family transcriptional regulator
VIKGVLSGYSLALLLQLWGRAFGEVSINQAVPEVFIGTALGAALSFVFVSLPLGWALCLLYATPLGSVIFLKKLLEDATEEKLQQTSEQPNPQVKPSQEPAHETVQLTARILMGTAAYGLVTGIMEGLGVGTESSISSLGLTLIMLVLYCAAALQLYEGKPLRGNAQSLAPTASALHTSPLAGAYRLALLLLLSGFVAYPLLESMGVAGEAVVMAGFLSVLTVLISLFLIMAHLNNKNTWRSFAKGFASLFAGNIVGIALGFVLQALPLSLNISAALVALAGITALYACLFLFTEADLTALSVEVAKTDTFELVCEYLTREAKLSKRESEILPLALKGRTAERMAQEFYISKNTVDTHLRRIYTKCKVRTRQELIDLSDSVAQQLSQKG